MTGAAVRVLNEREGQRSRSTGVKTYPSDRICAHPGCRTRLSIYNPSRYCCVHAKAVSGHRPEPRRASNTSIERECANPRCGETFTTTNAQRRYCSDRCRMQAFQERQRRADNLSRSCCA